MAGALFRAALVAACLRGAFPPVDLRAVCFVRAMLNANVLNAALYLLLCVWKESFACFALGLCFVFGKRALFVLLCLFCFVCFALFVLLCCGLERALLY